MKDSKTIKVIFPGGRASFGREFIKSFGSLEALKEGAVLVRVSHREEVLAALWAEANAGKRDGGEA